MMTILPLRKKTRAGVLYTRPSEIESLLVELSSLTHEELIERAAIPTRTDPGYVPSECLVYFIRASRNDDRETWFGQLFRILTERVLRRLPKAESLDENITLLSNEEIRDSAFGKFCELLSADRKRNVDRLDYFEIRFDGALANLRRDAQEKVWREANQSRPLENDDKSSELSPEVEEAAGSYDSLIASDFEDKNYRLRLAAAIDTLPPEQRRVVHMLSLDFPIDSKNPGVMTISKALGRSEKTIRTYRDKAFAALRTLLNEGEDR